MVHRKGVFGRLKVTFVKRCEEEKGEGQFLGTHISQTTGLIIFKFGIYMEGIKFVNLIEIDPVVIEIQGVENGELAVPVNNTLVRHTVFLAADTRLCLDVHALKYNCICAVNNIELPKLATS